MRYLLLMKHAMPKINPKVNPHLWYLGKAGRKAARAFAPKLALYQPAQVLASPEPKALETGRIVAEELGLPVETVGELHEHLRRREPFGDQAQFESRMARFFRQPDKLVYGEETADQAHRRFQEAVEEALERYPEDNLLIASHGTVITLLISRACGQEPFPLWRQLGLPSAAVVRLPDWKFEGVVD